MLQQKLFWLKAWNWTDYNGAHSDTHLGEELSFRRSVLRWKTDGARQTARLVGVIWFSATLAVTSLSRHSSVRRASRFSSGRSSTAARAAWRRSSLGMSGEEHGRHHHSFSVQFSTNLFSSTIRLSYIKLKAQGESVSTNICCHTTSCHRSFQLLFNSGSRPYRASNYLPKTSYDGICVDLLHKLCYISLYVWVHYMLDLSYITLRKRCSVHRCVLICLMCFYSSMATTSKTKYVSCAVAYVKLREEWRRRAWKNIFCVLCLLTLIDLQEGLWKFAGKQGLW